MIASIEKNLRIVFFIALALFVFELVGGILSNRIYQRFLPIHQIYPKYHNACSHNLIPADLFLQKDRCSNQTKNG